MQFEVNLFGLARLVRFVLPHMRKQKSGRIINVSSMGGRLKAILEHGTMQLNMHLKHLVMRCVWKWLTLE